MIFWWTSFAAANIHLVAAPFQSLSPLVREHPPHRMLQELRARAQAQLGANILAVRFDRVNAQVQLFGDGAGASAAPDHFEDLQLAVGETSDNSLSLVAVERPIGESPHQVAAQIALAGQP